MPFKISLSKLPIGWYSVDIAAHSDNRTWVHLPMTAALLGQDTRLAVADSPYASRTASILQPPAPETHGILLEKAGIRGITPMSAGLNVGETVYGQWRVRGWQIPYFTSSATNPMQAEAEIENKIREYLQKWPSAKTALIFHESAVGPCPPELVDAEAPELDEATKKRNAQIFERGCRTAKVYREKFPHIRLQVGNSGSSLFLMGTMMRMNFPREYIDAMGEESLGQAKIPETPHYEYGNGTAHNFWYLKQLAKKMNYGDLPVEPASEWKGRQSTDLDDATKAAWDMRDLLISYAFGCRQIRTPDLTDQGSMFYNNEYGSQGALRRYPLLYPKQSYVATATLTRILDRVEMLQQMPTGSATAYVLKFKRADKKFIYACWLPRGEANLIFEFAKKTDLLLVGMLGKETPISVKKGKATVPVSTAPAYLISSRPATSVAFSASHHQQPPIPWQIIQSLDATEEWEIKQPDPKRFTRRSATHYDGIRDGTFSLKTAHDKKQGAYLEWALEDANDNPAACFGSLQLKTPIPLPGEPDTIGVLVKGNASWARLNFRIIDADGETWETGGGDWPANLSINFQGWNWVAFPLNLHASWPHCIYPNWIKGYWRRISQGPNKAANNKIDYPVSFAGLSVTMPRNTLNLTKRVTIAESALGLKAVAAGKSP